MKTVSERVFSRGKKEKMAKKVSFAEPPALLRAEKALGIFAAAYGLYHTLLLLCAYLFRSHPVYQVLEGTDPWLAIALLAVFLGYCALVLVRFPRRKERVKALLHRVFLGDQLFLTLLFVWAVIGCVVLQSGGRDAFFTWTNAQGEQVALNNAVAFRINDRQLLDMAVSFFVLVPIAAAGDGKLLRRVLKNAARVLVAAATVFMAWVLVNYYGRHLINLMDGKLQIGPDSIGRLVLNCNPNTTGAFAAVFLMLAMYLAFTEKQLWARVLSALAAAVQLFPLILSGSRTAVYSTMLACAAVAFRFVWGRLPRERFPSAAVRVLLSAAAGAVCAGLILLLNAGIYRTYAQTAGLGGGASFITRESGGNGRFDLWGDVLSAVFASGRNAVTGVTPGLVELAIGLVRGDVNNALYTHNQLLQMLLAFGIPGLALFVLWLVKLAKKCFRVAMNTKYYVLAAAVLLLVVTGATESYLVAYTYFCGSAFFLLCGAVRQLDWESGEPATGKK